MCTHASRFRDYAMLQVYIRSFNFDTKVEYQEDYTDFLCKYGLT